MEMEKPQQPQVPEKLMQAYMQELAFQRGMLGDRALGLAGELSVAKERIAELEAELGELRRGKPQAVK